jgi:hypothetical protein
MRSDAAFVSFTTLVKRLASARFTVDAAVAAMFRTSTPVMANPVLYRLPVRVI